MASPAATLSSGFKLPLLGFGTWQGGNTAETAALIVALKEAIKAGFRHIDCAAIYGNQKQIGEALAELFADASIGVKREDVFITSKLWNTEHKKEDVLPALKQTLSDLGLEYLDLYLVHWPLAFERDAQPPKQIAVPCQETWQAMESLVDAGLVRSIGVSNWTTILLNDLLSYARIKPAVNQVERHPYLSQPSLVSFCAEHGVVVTAYSPLGSPAFVEKNSVPFPALLDDAVIKAVAAEHSKTPAQVLIRWNIQSGIAAVPKTGSVARIHENFDVLNWSLTEDDMKKIDELDRNQRLIRPTKFFGIDVFA